MTHWRDPRGKHQISGSAGTGAKGEAIKGLIYSVIAVGDSRQILKSSGKPFNLGNLFFCLRLLGLFVGNNTTVKNVLSCS